MWSSWSHTPLSKPIELLDFSTVGKISTQSKLCEDIARLRSLKISEVCVLFIQAKVLHCSHPSTLPNQKGYWERKPKRKKQRKRESYLVEHTSKSSSQLEERCCSKKGTECCGSRENKYVWRARTCEPSINCTTRPKASVKSLKGCDNPGEVIHGGGPPASEKCKWGFQEEEWWAWCLEESPDYWERKKNQEGRGNFFWKRGRKEIAKGSSRKLGRLRMIFKREGYRKIRGNWNFENLLRMQIGFSKTKRGLK